MRDLRHHALSCAALRFVLALVAGCGGDDTSWVGDWSGSFEPVGLARFPLEITIGSGATRGSAKGDFLSTCNGPVTCSATTDQEIHLSIDWSSCSCAGEATLVRSESDPDAAKLSGSFECVGLGEGMLTRK
jgi:hypothetical protein